MKRKLIIALLCTICLAFLICLITDKWYINQLERQISERDTLIQEVLK